MARIRSLKPDFFRSVTIAKLSFGARLTFQGLWCHADDDGRYRYEPALVKADVWPLDDDITASQVATWVGELEALGRVCCYTAAGRAYLHIVNWEEHQKIDRKGQSKLPPCPKDTHGAPPPHRGIDESSTNTRRAFDEDSELDLGSRSKERERDSATRVAPRRALALVEPSAETAQTVLGAYIDWRRAQGVNGIDKRTTGLLAKQLRQAFDAGHPPDVIKRGLLDWHQRDQHPSTLASFIDVQARGGHARASPTKAERQRQQLYTYDQALGAWADQMEAHGSGPDPVAPDRRQAERQLPRPGDPA